MNSEHPSPVHRTHICSRKNNNSTVCWWWFVCRSNTTTNHHQPLALLMKAILSIAWHFGAHWVCLWRWTSSKRGADDNETNGTRLLWARMLIQCFVRWLLEHNQNSLALCCAIAFVFLSFRWLVTSQSIHNRIHTPKPYSYSRTI